MLEKIMIIDDSLTSRMYIKKCISMVIVNPQLVIIESPNGAEALEKLKQEIVDLIISDINMPVMNGITMLTRLKENPNWQQIPVIFISSMINDERLAQLRELGATDIIKKPVSPTSINQALLKFTSEDTNQGWG